MKRLQERYANDREKLSKEMMALYQKEEPILWAAVCLCSCRCLFFCSTGCCWNPLDCAGALYLLDRNLGHESFFNLAAADGRKHLPNAGTKPPVVTYAGADDGDAHHVYGFVPIFPAGLVLYWLISNLLSLAQQTYVSPS